MNAIRVHGQLDSSFLTLPEVQPLLGKQVEVVIYEQPPQTPATEQDWANFFARVDGDLIDEDLINKYRAFDRSHNVAPQL
ncbi:MAG: hypothetical protein K8R36_07880 [Planctomycetales bacterium]|nr:hypothetical protein [Planctomycetales bacterium]